MLDGGENPRFCVHENIGQCLRSTKGDKFCLDRHSQWVDDSEVGFSTADLFVTRARDAIDIF